MKLLFNDGKQQEFLRKEKENSGLSWNEFTNLLRLRYGRLKSFLYEGVLIDESIFDKLSLKTHYEKFIIKKLDNNWRQSKGGFNSKGRLKEIKISGHSVDDRDYLLNFVNPLCEKLFGIKSRFYQSETKKCFYVMADGRRIVEFFEKNGFKAGNKIVNQISILYWIKRDNEFLAVCLRGLFDTDGSFYKLTNQNSYQINFKNYNLRLLKDVRNALLKLCINCSKIICNRSIVITKKSVIEKFYKLIGFSNPKHLNKIKKLF